MARKSHQRGSVVTRKYEYGVAYLLRYRIRNSDGSWVHKTETLRECPDKKTALMALEDKLREINSSNGCLSENFKITFSELLDTYWPHYLDNASVKASTRASYESLIEKWIRPFFGEERLVQIGPYEVSCFMSWLRQEGLSPKTCRNIYTVLKQLLDVAVDNDLLKSSPIRPKLHRPKVTQKEKVVLTVPEAQAVLGALHGKWRAPVWTLALTGLRQGELLALRWQDLDLLEQRIQVQNSLWRRQLGTPKTGSSCRHVVMPDVLRDILVAHRSTPTRRTLSSAERTGALWIPTP